MIDLNQKQEKPPQKIDILKIRLAQAVTLLNKAENLIYLEYSGTKTYEKFNKDYEDFMRNIYMDSMEIKSV